jgi:CBS domain-containing membrane protein
MLHKILQKILSFLDRLAPGQPSVPLRKALSISISVGLTLFAIVFLNQAYGTLNSDESMVLAVFGVSALLIFTYLKSKLYAPLTILEANLLASCIAFACVYLFSAPLLGLTIAILSTILGLYLLGSIHPPALFLAVVIVMARVSNFDFIFYPVLVDSSILALASYLNRSFFKA